MGVKSDNAKSGIIVSERNPWDGMGISSLSRCDCTRKMDVSEGNMGSEMNAQAMLVETPKLCDDLPWRETVGSDDEGQTGQEMARIEHAGICDGESSDCPLYEALGSVLVEVLSKVSLADRCVV